MSKKLFTPFIILLCCVSAYGQVPTDTSDLRTKINSWIVTNGTKQVTASQVNQLFNGVASLMKAYAVDSAYRVADTLFLVRRGFTTIKVTLNSGGAPSESDPTVPTVAKALTTSDTTRWNNKQDALTQGTGISITANVVNAQTTTAQWNANKLQGSNISSTTPSTGQVLKWNGSEWAPATDSVGVGGSTGEANTASNQGGGVGVFKTKSGIDLELKSLTSDTNLLWTANTNDNHIKVAPNTLNYINYLNRPVPINLNSLFIGDSQTYGYDINTGQHKAWPAYVGDYWNMSSVNNLAVSGIGTRRAYKTFAENFDPSLPAPLATMFGFNDVRGTTDTAHRFEVVRSGHRATGALLFSKPSTIQFYATTNSGTVNPNISTSLSCSGCTATSEDSLREYGSRAYWYRHNDASNSGMNWWKKASISANETVTISNVEGTGIIVSTWAATSGWSRIEVRVDGTLMTTYDPNGRIGMLWSDGFINNGICNDAIVIHGLRDTLHVVQLKFLDAGAMGGFDYIAGLKSFQACLGSPLYVLDLPHMNATGYAYPGGEVTEAQLDSCSSMRERDLKYYFPNYPIHRIKINDPGYYDPNDPTQIQTDGIHISAQGQWNVARKVNDDAGPKWLSGGTASNLDQVLQSGNTSPRTMHLSGYKGSSLNLRVGNIGFQSAASNQSLIYSNAQFDGANFKYLDNGPATLFYMNNAGYFELKNATSGTAGNNITFNGGLTMTPSRDLWLGGTISNSADGTGANLRLYSNGNMVLPNIGSFGPASAISTFYPIMIWANGTQPGLAFYNAVAGTDQKLYDMTVDNTGEFSMRGAPDAYNTATYVYKVKRTGTTKYNLDWQNGYVRISDSLKVDNIPSAGSITTDSILVKRDNVVYSRPAATFATILKGSTTWQPGTVSAGSSATTTITVTGAALGDNVTISKASGAYSNGELYDAFVSATNTVTIRVHNVSTGSANYNTTETYNVIVLKY